MMAVPPRLVTPPTVSVARVSHRSPQIVPEEAEMGVGVEAERLLVTRATLHDFAGSQRRGLGADVLPCRSQSRAQHVSVESPRLLTVMVLATRVGADVAEREWTT